MPADHYFTAEPASPEESRTIQVKLAGRQLSVVTANGVFSPAHVDTGTQVLLHHVPTPPPSGNLLDLGCGWGPIAITLALESPHATVWAVDVNERALDLVRRNAELLGLTNITAARPEDVPSDMQFAAIWSNPPIRVGKNELHSMLTTWLDRLALGSDAWLVVQRNLGSDSLQRWMEATLPAGYTVLRAASNKGFRVLRVRHRVPGAPMTGAIVLPPL